MALERKIEITTIETLYNMSDIKSSNKKEEYISLVCSVLKKSEIGKDLDLTEAVYRTIHDRMSFSFNGKDQDEWLKHVLHLAEKHKNSHVFSDKRFNPQIIPLSTNKFIYHMQLIYQRSLFYYDKYPRDMQEYITKSIFTQDKTSFVSLMKSVGGGINNAQLVPSTEGPIQLNLIGETFLPNEEEFDKSSGLRKSINLNTVHYY